MYFEGRTKKNPPNVRLYVVCERKRKNFLRTWKKAHNGNLLAQLT